MYHSKGIVFLTKADRSKQKETDSDSKEAFFLSFLIKPKFQDVTKIPH